MSHILIVDDEEEIRLLFQESLEVSGHTCISSPGGSSALEVLAAEKIDLVVVDITMPGMSGLTLFEHIKERYPDVAVIFVTAMDDINLAVQSLKDGAYGYLAKPVTLKRLNQEITEALVKRASVLSGTGRHSHSGGLHDITQKERTSERQLGDAQPTGPSLGPARSMTGLKLGDSLGRYQVQEEIGRGGCAYVFRAHDTNLDREVALKVLPRYHSEEPLFVARFKREARTVAGLSHPNILQIYDFGEDQGFTYIVTKHVTGGALESRMGQRHSLDDVLSIVSPLAGALDYAHRLGIVHRDFKPSNVLVDSDTGPLLADFGVARIIESSVQLTRTGWVLGTPKYMSPEQALGHAADHRADLYSFAIVLYELLLARPPFKAETPVATLLAHVHEPVPPPREIDPDFDPRLEAVLLRALSKDPNERYQTAGELVRAIPSPPLTPAGVKGYATS